MAAASLGRRIPPLVPAFCLLLTVTLSPAAQEFGFGFEDEGEALGGGGGGSALAVSLGGEAGASMLGYFEDFADGLSHTRLGDLFSGKLNFTAETSRAKGVINLKLAPGLVYYGEKSPVYVDEAYAAAYFGRLDLEGGLRKLTWGRADSLDPLDVVNPLDYSDLSGLNDVMNMKIPRPWSTPPCGSGSSASWKGSLSPTLSRCGSPNRGAGRRRISNC
jgi:hypothetical protein